MPCCFAPADAFHGLFWFSSPAFFVRAFQVMLLAQAFHLRRTPCPRPQHCGRFLSLLTYFRLSLTITIFDFALPPYFLPLFLLPTPLFVGKFARHYIEMLTLTWSVGPLASDEVIREYAREHFADEGRMAPATLAATQLLRDKLRGALERELAERQARTRAEHVVQQLRRNQHDGGDASGGRDGTAASSERLPAHRWGFSARSWHSIAAHSTA